MKSELDYRYIVLLALYAEYLMDDGDFGNVSGKAMGVSGRTFAWTLMRLQTEGLIAGCVFQPPHAASASRIFGVLRDGLYLTGTGVEKCEALLSVGRDDRDVYKLTRLAAFLRDAGANVIAGLIMEYLG